MKLIEGRWPHIMVSKQIARITNQEAEYSDLKGMDDDYYKEVILTALKDHGRLQRKDLDKLLTYRLPNILNDAQKKNKIDYLLKNLRATGIIRVGLNRQWELGSE